MPAMKMVPESEYRKGQIALALLKYRMRRDGLELRPRNFRADVGNTVIELNKLDTDLHLNFDEAMAFMKEIAQPFIDQMFALQDKKEAK